MYHILNSSREEQVINNNKPEIKQGKCFILLLIIYNHGTNNYPTIKKLQFLNNIIFLFILII